MTENYSTAMKFRCRDAAAVLVNALTRLVDGSEFGRRRNGHKHAETACQRADGTAGTHVREVRSSRTGTDSRGLVEMGGSLLEKVRQRVGLMGGTFDPIHYGHLVAAEEARVAFDLSKVIFVPSGRPPHKIDRRYPADRTGT